MKYRMLGRSGAVVSVQALGTMTFGAEATEATSSMSNRVSVGILSMYSFI
jgi:aryl-alcohol dehydrogenase-like predicted oxidoreductase